jgi:hypothetical protein
MSDEQDISKELVNTIGSPDLSILGEIAEAAIDTLTNDTFASNLPLIGSIVAIGKGVLSIRERLFIKKVAAFLFELRTVSEKERRTFVESLGDGKEQQKIGEAILLILDRLDDMDKPKIIGRLFKARIEGKISYHEFRLAASIIEKIMLQDLEKVREFNYDFEKIEDNLLFERLLATGFLTGVVWSDIILSNTAKTVIEIVFKKNAD